MGNKCSNGGCSAKARITKGKSGYCKTCFESKKRWVAKNWATDSLNAGKKAYKRTGIWIIASGR